MLAFDIPWLVELIPGVTLIGVLGYLLGVVITSRQKHSLDRKLETFKSDLAHELETFKASVSLRLNAKTGRFAKTHDEVIVTLNGLFERMARLQLVMEDYTAPFTEVDADPNEKNEAEKQLAEALKSLNHYLLARALFLPDYLYQEAFGFWYEAFKKAKDYQFYARRKFDPANAGRKSAEVYKYVTTESRVLMDEIKVSAKELMQIESPDEFKKLMAKEWEPKPKQVTDETQPATQKLSA